MELTSRNGSQLVKVRSRGHILIYFCLGLSLAACVTIKVGNSDSAKAEEVQVEPPPKPFDEVKTSHADRAWQNLKTGSSISYTSACGESTDPTLENLRGSLLQGVSDLQIASEKKAAFSDREGLDSIFTGQVDGVPVKMRIIVFKKNSCNYHLSLVSVKSHFSTDLGAFELFLKGFRAP